MKSDHRPPSSDELPDDCYAKKAKVWIWLLGIIVAGITVYVLVVFSRQTPVGARSTERPSPRSVQGQPVALTACPYCPGYLDSQGRCNVRNCPVYSRNWGEATAKGGRAPLAPVQIKELALEAVALTKTGNVILHAVYSGGVADKAGLQVGDLIHRFNGRRVKNVEQFQSFVSRAAPESNVKVRVLRNGEKRQFVVMVGEGEMEAAVVPIMNPASGPSGGTMF